MHLGVIRQQIILLIRDLILQIKLNELVHPGKAIADYRTEITGVSAEDLVDVKCSLADVQVIFI